MIRAPHFRSSALKQPWITFLIDGGRDGLGVALACAAIGIIIGAVTTLPLSDWPRGIAFLGALLIAITAMNASHIGYFKGDLNLPARTLLLTAGLAILIPGAWLTVCGTALAVGFFAICWWKHRQVTA